MANVINNCEMLYETIKPDEYGYLFINEEITFTVWIDESGKLVFDVQDHSSTDEFSYEIVIHDGRLLLIKISQLSNGETVNCSFFARNTEANHIYDEENHSNNDSSRIDDYDEVMLNENLYHDPEDSDNEFNDSISFRDTEDIQSESSYIDVDDSPFDVFEEETDHVVRYLTVLHGNEEFNILFFLNAQEQLDFNIQYNAIDEISYEILMNDGKNVEIHFYNKEGYAAIISLSLPEHNTD